MENSSKVKIAVSPERLCDFEWCYINGEEIQSQKQDFTYVLMKMYFERITGHLSIDKLKSLYIKFNLRKNRKVNL